MMQQFSLSVCCRRCSWNFSRSLEEVVASMRARSRDSNGIWLATCADRVRVRVTQGAEHRSSVFTQGYRVMRVVHLLQALPLEHGLFA